MPGDILAIARRRLREKEEDERDILAVARRRLGEKKKRKKRETPRFAVAPGRPAMVPLNKAARELQEKSARGFAEGVARGVTFDIWRPEWGGDPGAQQAGHWGTMAATLKPVSAGVTALGRLASRVPVLGRAVQAIGRGKEAVRRLPTAARIPASAGIGWGEAQAWTGALTGPGAVVHGDPWWEQQVSALPYTGAIGAPLGVLGGLAQAPAPKAKVTAKIKAAAKEVQARAKAKAPKPKPPAAHIVGEARTATGVGTADLTRALKDPATARDIQATLGWGDDKIARLKSALAEGVPKVEPSAVPLEPLGGKPGVRALPPPGAERPPTPPRPAAVGEPPPAGGDPVGKLTGLINAAKPARAETRALQRAALKGKAARLTATYERYTGEEAFKRGWGAMKGELPVAEFEPPRAALTTAEGEALMDQIRTTAAFTGREPFARQNTYVAFTKLLGGQIPQKAEIRLLERVFGPELAKAILGKRPWGARAWDAFVEGAGLSRAVMTAYDLSAAARQGMPMLTRAPLIWARGVRSGLKVLFSEKNMEAKVAAMKDEPLYDVAKDAGVYFRTEPISAVTLSEAEEMFASRIAERIPGIRHSERDFTMTLDTMGFDYFKKVYKAHNGQLTDVDLTELGRFTNRLLGRGGLGKFERVGADLAVGIFAPRYVASRIQAPLMMLTSPSAIVRKEAARVFAQYVGAGITTLAMLDLSGLADVEVDWRSSDFGKVRVGNMRFDFWAGWQPMVRHTAQFTTGERKLTDSGRIAKLARNEVLARFARSKVSPVVGTGWNLAKGETYEGREIEPNLDGAIRVLSELTPLAWQDIFEAAAEEGLMGGLLAGPPAIIGIGVQTHRQDPLRTYWRGADEYVPKLLMKSWSKYKQLPQRDKDDYLRLHPTLQPYAQLEKDIRERLRLMHPELDEELVKRGYTARTPTGRLAQIQEQREALR